MKMSDKKRRPILTLQKPAEPVRPMTVSELVAAIRNSEEQIERIKQRILVAVQVKIGDTVDINYGGSLGKKMVVNTVEVSRDEAGTWRFIAEGAALTIEGKPGSRRGIHTFQLEE